MDQLNMSELCAHLGLEDERTALKVTAALGLAPRQRLGTRACNLFDRSADLGDGILAGASRLAFGHLTNPFCLTFANSPLRGVRQTWVRSALIERK